MELNKIIRKVVNDKISEIHTCLPAKIERYDPEKMRADVVLLSKKELEGEKEEIPPIVEVPVALLKAGPFVIRQPFEKGDPVLVVFGEKALDKLLITGNPEDPQMTRQHSFDDAVVIGGLQLEQDPDLNSDYTDDLLIENQEEESRIVLKADESKIIINADIVELAGGGPGVAREGDSVQVEVTSGSSAGTYTGSITSSSNKVNSG